MGQLATLGAGLAGAAISKSGKIANTLLEHASEAIIETSYNSIKSSIVAKKKGKK